jgi:long-chain-fatty-acid--CoA ligase ACSBG
MGVPGKNAPVNKPAALSKYPAGDAPFWAHEPTAQKKIQMAETGVASAKGTPPNTIMAVFEQAVKRKGDKVALRTENMPDLKKGETPPPPVPLAQWKSWTWKQYYEDVRNIAAALLELGVQQHDSVNIFGFNSPEWLMAEFGAIFCGAKAAGIYPSDTADQVQFKSFHSNAAAAFVENDGAYSKFKEVIDELPYMKVIIGWAMPLSGELARKDGTKVKLMTFKDLLAMGAKTAKAALDARMKQIKAEHCCALIYTSGTTGKPKAVMISHDNIIFVSNSALPMTGIGSQEERLLSYLPLSHVAGMLFDIIAPVVATAYDKGSISTNFARPYDLKAGTIGQRLVTVEPTVFLGVPRVWEKIAEKLQAVGAATTGLKKKLSTTAKAKGLAASMNQQLGGNGSTPFLYGIYSKLLAVIKKKLGLHMCRFAFAGAAPMTRETLSYFGSLGINVNEAYGMSESTGATTMSTEKHHQWGTVGFELSGCEVKCFKMGAGHVEAAKAKDIWNPTEAEQGEVCFRGRHIMIGYMSNAKLGEAHVEEIKKKNAEAIDSEGWLHSGDKGAISVHGMVRITGRYKELIIGAGGENIAPVPIEDHIKALCPYISNVMMIGDKRKFNVCLVSLKCKGATGELPGTTDLDGPAKKWGATIKDAVNNKDMIKAIEAAITATNKNGEVCPSNAAYIQKFSIIPIDFSVVGDELTATLKLKRSVAEAKYKDLIDKMYDSEATFVPAANYDAHSHGDSAAASFKGTAPLEMVSDEDVKAMEKHH